MKITKLPPGPVPDWAGQYITNKPIRWAMKDGARDFTINQKQIDACHRDYSNFEGRLRDMLDRVIKERGEK